MIPATWMRGGTSKGLFILRKHLPISVSERDKLLLQAIGSPDPTGMQLNGIGGGISSTSKVAILSPSAKPGFDVDYLFGQVPLRGDTVDWSGSCGNLSAAVGLFALQQMEMGDQTRVNSSTTKKWSKNGQNQRHQVRVWQENLGYEIVVHVPDDTQTDLTTSIAGVPGSHPAIFVELIDPNNGGDLLPTKNPTDKLVLENGKEIEATLVLSANPTVFVRASDLQLSGSELPSEIQNYRETMEPNVLSILAQACAKMGIKYGPAVRLCWLATPDPGARYTTTSGSAYTGDCATVVARITTEGRVHHAFTGTGAVNLACALAIPGTVPWNVSRALDTDKGSKSNETQVILHPGGTTEVAVQVEPIAGSGGYQVKSTGMMRSARTLMSGAVNTAP